MCMCMCVCEMRYIYIYTYIYIRIYYIYIICTQYMYTVLYSICKIIYQFYYLFDGFTRKNCGLH